MSEEEEIEASSAPLIEHLIAPRWIEAPDEDMIEASLDVLFHGIASDRRSVPPRPPAPRGEDP